MGAAGRDFHDFNVVYRDDAHVEVVAFTAAQIPGIASRRYPPGLAGPHHPKGIPIRPEGELARIVRDERVDEVVFAYSDLPHEQVMHAASTALAAGADFSLLGPRSTMLRSTLPVVAVCAVRTGAGKSQTSRAVARLLREAGRRVTLIRHPMPYGDLEAMRVQRFATQADIDRAHPTLEEREEYELPVHMGIVTYAGVDYAEILRRAEAEADVLVWDGGNNDFPFIAPDLMIVVADALRPAHGVSHHPGETNLRMADAIVVNKIDSATREQVDEVLRIAEELNPGAIVVRAESPVTLDDGPEVEGRDVLVVEDGPTITHGGMPFGAGAVAARRAGARTLVDPRPFAVGSIAEAMRRHPHIGPVLPAMGYSDRQRRELEATIAATPCDLVVAGTPVALDRAIRCRHPVRRARYGLRVLGRPSLEELLGPVLARTEPRGS